MEKELGYIMAYEETQSDSVIKVEIVNRENDLLTVRHLDSQEMEDIPEDEFFAIDFEAEKGCQDLAALKSFNEAALLVNLQSRYRNKEIYTRMYSNLIVINPYSLNKKLTSKKKIKKYWERQNENLKPHIFEVGYKAHKNLKEKGTSQVVLISGESGAGKTESTKHLIKFLTKSNQGELQEIEKKIISCSPILEAFGNAKTIKNNNSSRFGKFIKLFYDPSHSKITSASIESFLLEKSRIVKPSLGERNFHIFYLMCSYLPTPSLQSLQLVSSSSVDLASFTYLGSDSYIKSEVDSNFFSEIIESFSINSFTNQEISSIWKMLSGILHLGNIQFNDEDFNENNPCCLIDPSHADKVAQVLEIPIYELITSLTTFRRVIDKTEIISPVNKVTCESFRDTLAKYIYDRIFNWIIKKLNQGLKGTEGSFIGILDIYGFEVFKTNSFEQLCINFANEKLHQLSIHSTFKAEIEELKNENLFDSISSIEFTDNQGIIDLLELSPSGIFRLIDEACLVKSTEENLLASIKNKNKESKFFQTPKTNTPVFTVKHTACPVSYTIDGFISKNIDEVRPEFESILMSSANKTMKVVFRSEVSKGKFAGDKFRKEISMLMQEISKCEPWFVRCIKPNETKAPWKYDQRVVLNQIQYLGLLDCIMIRKKGFPIRMTHERFFDEFKVLKGFGFTDRVEDFREFAREIVEDVNNKGLILGERKVFMKEEIENVLMGIKREKIEKIDKEVRVIQGWVRSRNMYSNFKKLIKSTKLIQRSWQAHQSHKSFKTLRSKVILIQKWYKSILYREQIAIRDFGLQIFYQYLKIKIEDFFLEKCFNLAIKTQKIYRGHRVRRLLKGKTLINRLFNKRAYKPTYDLILLETKRVSAIKIQKVFRGYYIRTHVTLILTQLLKANKRDRMAIRIQKWLRGALIRKRLQKITKAAIKIQTFHRSNRIHKSYQSSLKAVSLIQSYFRSYSLRRSQISTLLSNFLSKESAILKNLSTLEHNELFASNTEEITGQCSMPSSSYPISSSNISNLPNLSNLSNPSNPSNPINSSKVLRSYSNYSDSVSTFSKEISFSSKQISPFHVEKIYFLIRPFDLEILSDESVIYEGLWGRELETLSRELSTKDEHLLDLALGTCHTLALTSKGRVYAWGWNDKHQCGSSGARARVVEVGKDCKVVQVSAGEDHSLALTASGQVFAFGDNSRGQLGQANYSEYEKGVFVDLPCCKQVVAVNGQNMAVCEDGQLFIWPFETVHGERRSYPMRMMNEVPVMEVSAGFNFAVILSCTGIAYSLGSDNSYGQLGHGDLIARSTPTLILSLKTFGEKITTVSCGQSHVIAKSSLGKIFTWGKGKDGQLGHSSTSNELLPRQAQIRSTSKPIQISAGFRHSLVLSESRKVWLTGRSSSGTCSTFHEVSLINKSVEISKTGLEGGVVRISSVWCKLFSVMMVVLADMRYLQGSSLSANKINSALAMLAAKWTGKTPEPPIVESIHSLYPACLSKRNQARTGKSAKVRGFDEVKDRISEILKKPREKWTAEDSALIEYCTNMTN